VAECWERLLSEIAGVSDNGEAGNPGRATSA
jgi:hypothetical protein